MCVTPVIPKSGLHFPSVPSSKTGTPGKHCNFSSCLPLMRLQKQVSSHVCCKFFFLMLSWLLPGGCQPSHLIFLLNITHPFPLHVVRSHREPPSCVILDCYDQIYQGAFLTGKQKCCGCSSACACTPGCGGNGEGRAAPAQHSTVPGSFCRR